MLKKIIKFMAFAYNKLMTFLNLKSLVIDEGFPQKTTIPSTDQIATFGDCKTYLDKDI